MKKNFFLTLVLALVALFSIETATAQAPVDSPEQVITGLLNRIGGNGAADRFEIVIDANLAQDGKDVFVITSQNGNPCIKGNNQLSVATGINWYLNHYAHINLTWNKLSTDLVNASLPLPDETVTKECSADLRYYLNYCTFSYTSALWTEERWMQEIDWMALHGINMPLMLVGLDCVWYDLYTKAEYGYNYTPEEISEHIAGPAFQAWWAMINCEGHGGPNPAWWYERSRALATNMLARMRSYGMEPVLPGFCGEVPSSLKAKLDNDTEINTGGKWQGFKAPGLMGHKSTNWEKLAADYYDALEGVMGKSKYYSMDPFHEEATGLTGSSANDMKGYFQSCYAQMKANVGEGVVWVAQDWGSNPRDAMLTGLNNGELIVLDLFAEADPHYSNGYNGHDYIYCMLHNFGGRVGLHGRFNKTMDGYYAALAARGDQMVGIGATPEGVENNPMLYDMLFELPWRETAPDKTEWVNSYTVSRYGKRNETVQKAYSKLMQSVYNCTTGQQGTSEPIICAIPSLTATKVSTWASAAVDYEHEIVIAAADEMLSQVAEFDALNDNFNYDLLDVVRQALTNYALDMLAQLNSDYSANKFDATFSARKNHYLALIEDIDELLGTHQKFRLGNWAEMARAIVTEDAASRNGADGTDADWLEFDNLRRQITTWAPFWSSLRDYSNREWNGLVKDYYLERWKIYFDALEAGTESSLSNDYWYNYGNTYVHDDTKTYTAAPVGDTRTIARSAFDNYFFVDTDDKSNKVYFSRHIEQSKAADEYVKYAYRGEDFTFKIPEGTTATLSIDANSDGVFGDGETVNNNTFRIPADAATTTVKAFIVLSDNTEISFYVFLADLIETDRTVTVQAGDNGSVAIEGTAESSITNSEYVTMTATAASGYEFSHWVQVAGDGTETEASRENPFIYLGKDEATFKAYFIENIWGVPSEDWSDRGDITNKQYLTSITCVQEENTTEIYSASEATAGLFVPVATMINAAKGSRFTIDWQGDGNMKNCYLSAYIDLNKDGDFDDAGELIMVKGTLGGANNSVEKGPMQVLLPYDMPIGITHIRLRFDGAWKTNYNQNTKAFPASNVINRRCYEIALNVTEHSAGNSHIVITSNNTEWGTVRNITGVTGEDINVPSGTEICMEAFPKDGYMFVHWLDKYGRVASTNSSFYYTPCESGEFTAIFKEIPPETVEIDGWQIEYRTEPAQKINLGSEKPVAGKKYYIYANAKNNSSPLYLYNNAGSLATATVVDAANEDAYIWEATASGDYLTFESVATAGQYIGYGNSGFGLTVNTTPVQLDINSTYASGQMSNCVGIMRIGNDSNGKYMVTNKDGSAFNRNSVATNGDWCSDYVFVEIPGDVVILTNIRKSGNHDLVIPETVNILGEDLKIVGFDNGLFKDNKDLWSISLPATIEQLSSKVLFSTSVKGENTPTATGDNNPDNKIQVIDLGFTLKNSEAWTIRATYKSDGVSTFNEWGSPLLYPNENGTGSELFYLSSTNQWSSCWHVRAPFTDLGIDYFKDHTNTKISTFIAAIENKGNGNAVITITNSLGDSQISREVTFSYDNISAFSAKLPKGLDITNFEVLAGAEPDPFEGCTNLLGIEVADGCENYYVDETTRTLKSTGGTDLHTLASEDKREKLLALSELIDLTEALIAEVATNVNPTGKETAIGLQANDPNAAFYVSTNADQNTGGGKTDGAGIAGLVDNSNDTYFHSRWGGTDVNATHHIEVDLGEGNRLSDFKFSYVSANGPDPTKIVVKGSNNGEQFDQIGDTIIKSAINSGATYGSDIIEAEQSYRYLRFEVAKSYRWNSNANPQGEYCFSMKEFDIYDLTSSAEVAPKYANLAGVTAGDVEGVYDSMAEALYFYNNGGTAEQLQDAYEELEPLYTTLNAKKDKILNGVYNINFGGKPLFIAYVAANELNGLTGAGNAGFRLFDATTANTDSKYSTIQNNAIAAQAPADALFTIVPKDDYSGYHLSAQGFYMNTVTSSWSMQAFDTDVANAGVYLFEETETDIFKIKSKTAGVPYMNDWGPVFGNDLSSKENLSTFTLTPVTEYTVAVPANGATTLCLPFNVVLPEGVTAYDLANANITKANRYSTYELVEVAHEGDILAKNTPVIIKATEGDHILTITMDGEGAKSSVENSVLRSGIVKTTLADGNNYTFDGVDFNLVAAGTVIPANQCWMELDENLGDIVYGEAPAFILTTDEENPVLYKIQINRNYNSPNATMLEYNPNTGVVDIKAEAANSSWQAWYFMQGENGILIKPFNGDGKVLGADNNDNGKTKVWAVENGTKNICEWTIEKYNEWYNILGNGKCFSNNGGDNSGNMGFWNSKTDGGSQFKFVDAEFTDDNARFYQLKDLAESMDDATYYTGESVGLYSESGVKALTEKVDDAKALIDAGSDVSESDDCYAMYKALRAAKKDAYNAPAADKVYYIVSTATGDGHAYCTGKYVHTYSEPHVHKNTTWGDKEYNQRHLLFDAEGDIEQLSLAAFQFEETGTLGEYKMKNLHTGLYVKSFNKNVEHMGTVADAAVVKIAGIADGQVALKIGNNAPMHAQNDYSVIVTWDAAANNPSTWTINEVPQEDLNNIYKLTVPESGVTTLNLAFNVQLPEGVTAYDFVEGDIAQAEGSDRYEFNLTPVAKDGEVLAKNTPVIIKANAGEYNLKVTFGDNNVKNGTAGSVLRGNYWQTTVGTDAVNYLPAVVENEFVFNKVTADSTAVTANTVWAVLSSADNGETIYEFVPEPEAPEVSIVAGKVYRIKNYTVNTPAEYQYHYLANSNASIVFPTSVEESDKSAMWVCTSADEENHKYKFVSALGTASFGWKGAAEEAFEYTIAAGTIESTVTLINNNMSLALTTEAWNNKGNAAFNHATVGYGTNGMVQAEYWSTDWYLEEVENPNVSFTASINKGNLWATMYLPYAVTIPQGVDVYYAVEGAINGNVIALTQFIGTIPARTAVLLHRAGNAPSTGATENFEFALAEDVEAVENLFDGTIMRAAIAAPEGTRVYLLTNYNATEKFYWMADEYNKNCVLAGAGAGYVKNDANRAYLKIEENASTTSSYSFRFEGTTGVEDVKTENGEVKAIYDLQGRKLSEITEPGFYIVNGEKVFVK